MTTKSSQSQSSSKITMTLDYLTRLRWSIIDVLWMSSAITLMFQSQFVAQVVVILCGAFISVMAEKLHRNRTQKEMIDLVNEFDKRWMDLVDSGRVSDAISQYRRDHRSTLYEAKSVVLKYKDSRQVD